MKGCAIWLTGLSGSGKTTVAQNLKGKLARVGQWVEVLDGDVIRKSVCRDLGFSKEDRDENIRRVSFVAAYLATKQIVVCAFISPYREARRKARGLIDNFIEVYVKCSLEECERRDPKGNYAKARRGEIKSFTGIDDVYQEPENPEIILETDKQTVEECTAQILKYLDEKYYL